MTQPSDQIKRPIDGKIEGSPLRQWYSFTAANPDTGVIGKYWRWIALFEEDRENEPSLQRIFTPSTTEAKEDNDVNYAYLQLAPVDRNRFVIEGQGDLTEDLYISLLFLASVQDPDFPYPFDATQTQKWYENPQNQFVDHVGPPVEPRYPFKLLVDIPSDMRILRSAGEQQRIPVRDGHGKPRFLKYPSPFWKDTDDQQRKYYLEGDNGDPISSRVSAWALIAQRARAESGAIGFGGPHPRAIDENYTFWIRLPLNSKISAAQLKNVFNLASQRRKFKGKWILHDAIGEQQAQKSKEEFVFLSENPFQLYQTWIHRDDLGEWLRNHKGRPLPRAQDLEPAKRASSIEWLKKQEARKKEKLTDEALMKKYKGYFPYISGILHDQSTILFHNHTDKLTWIEKMKIVLSSNAIATAESKRQTLDVLRVSQGKLMHSATLLSDHLQRIRDPAFNEARQLDSGLWMAEWLHVSAFSFGGLLSMATREELGFEHIMIDEGDPDKEIIKKKIFEQELKEMFAVSEKLKAKPYLSSQIPLNLILGTSETNSVMCRYEKAWQSLFKAEENLRQRASGKNEDVQGSLDVEFLGDLDVIESNDGQQNPALFKRTPQYQKFQDLGLILEDPFNNPRLDTMLQRHLQNNHYARYLIDIGLAPSLKAQLSLQVQTGGEPAEEGGGKRLRHDPLFMNPWLRPVMKYTPSMASYSHILKVQSPTYPVSFYPFTRLFYHKGEGAVDDFLLEFLVEQADKELDKNKSLPKPATTVVMTSSQSRYTIGDPYKPNDQGFKT